MIAIFAAMTTEIDRFRRRLIGREDGDVAGYPISRGELGGRPVLVCRTGLGRRAEGAAREVLGRHRPWLALSTGTAGALTDELDVGDLVLCESVICASDGTPQGAPVRSDAALLRLAGAAGKLSGPRARRGGAVTVGSLVGSPEEKQALGQLRGVDVVEMESYWVGLAAAASGTPFLAARVVLDKVADSIPEVPGVVTQDGSQRTLRALPYALTHPLKVPQLLRIAASGRKASLALTRFLVTFVGGVEAPQRPATG